MATIMEMLNQGLGGLNTPLGQLGTNLLAQSGPQAGNPGGGARLGQALAGMSEQQRAQALQQYREQMIAQQQAAQDFQVQQARAKAEQQQRQQQAFADPNLQAQLGPMAKQLAAMGIDPETILKANSNDALQAHRAAQLQQQSSQFAQQQARLSAGGGGQPPGPKVPTPRQVLEEPLENGMLQKHIFDPATNTYKPYGKPYRQYAPGKVDPMQTLLGEVAPDDSTGAGPAVPGLPGSSASVMQPPARQGAELLMHGSGSNPMARQPATPKTQAEYAALPQGTQYVDPATGRVATKKGR
ncbi:hypothetical protein [Pseudomonas chlororaphis]|uniref:hypothetical protein n=1 Tax=Pseudomonas chlororaphis TaxID=587753 RepID=UPI001B304210|nr:hypothetical protein [Pseudomonas chlororaphis]MBP5057599.1 hypothetical protein [Pseudomonas chlororaphis]MBP5140409.1 hypothetical protein [Pseudomonas chlororaphis]QTT99115.1 hypothetical protein HUT26_07485 [Pseudomonas chlororaphis]